MSEKKKGGTRKGRVECIEIKGHVVITSGLRWSKVEKQEGAVQL